MNDDEDDDDEDDDDDDGDDDDDVAHTGWAGQEREPVGCSSWQPEVEKLRGTGWMQIQIQIQPEIREVWDAGLTYSLRINLQRKSNKQ